MDESPLILAKGAVSVVTAVFHEKMHMHQPSLK